MSLAQVSSPSSSGCRLVSVDGRNIPLVGVHVQADAGGGLARVVLEQRFANRHAEPLTATYQLPLPADGAVVGFSFLIGERRIVGEIDRKKRARQRFEQAVAQGRTAAILDQDRSSLFTQEIGNIPPGAEIIAEITVEQPLTWKQGSWEWRFPTVVAPRFMGSATPDVERVSVDVADGPVSAKAGMTLQIRDAMTGVAQSVSHTLDGRDGLVTLPAAAALDRDIVVRWPVAAPTPATSLEVTRRAGDLYGLLTVVPPTASAARRVVPRDLILLLDTSGSMGGRPLDQAKAVCRALIDGMTAQDRLEMISFASRPERWTAQPMAMHASGRAEARRWLESLRARGGTQMRDGIIEALTPLRDGAQRQVVLVSDGLIGFEKQVISAILERLPMASRVHTVGVGSGVNRSLTGPVARAGGGVEVVIGLDESPHEAAEILLARTSRPEVVDFSLSGSALLDHAPCRLHDLFAGAPTRISLQLQPGTLVLSGHTADGPWQEVLTVPAEVAGREVIATRFGREKVEDLELRIAAGGRKSETDAEIEVWGLKLAIATRLTSWIAATAEATVDPGAPTRAERVPHAMPYGMSAEGVGLRRPSPAPLKAVGRFAHMNLGSAVVVPPPMAAPAAPPPAQSAPVFADGVGGGGAFSDADDDAEMLMEESEDAPAPGGVLGVPEPVVEKARSRRPRAGSRAPAKPSAPPPPAARSIGRRSVSEDSDEGYAEERKRESAPRRRRTLRDLFTRKKKATKGRAAPEEAVAGAKALAAPRTLRAVVRLRKDGVLVLEIVLTDAMYWQPNGTSLGVPLGGTREGQYDAGKRLRLMLPLADGAPLPATITVDNGNTSLTLQVESR